MFFGGISKVETVTLLLKIVLMLHTYNLHCFAAECWNWWQYHSSVLRCSCRFIGMHRTVDSGQLISFVLCSAAVHRKVESHIIVFNILSMITLQQIILLLPLSHLECSRALLFSLKRVSIFEKEKLLISTFRGKTTKWHWGYSGNLIHIALNCQCKKWLL